MVNQILFTSTPSGLDPGRSGFQAVARHHDIPPLLITALERESVFDFGAPDQEPPAICKFLHFDFGDNNYYVLTRIQASGIDHTGRPNHLAHHLIFDSNNLPSCPPAAFFVLWPGWRENWDAKPRYLGTWDKINLEDSEHPFRYRDIALPARNWEMYTGDAGIAALPLLQNQQKVLLAVPEGKENTLLWLIFETQSLLDPMDAWQWTFTTGLNSGEDPARYRWVGIPEKSDSSVIPPCAGVLLHPFGGGIPLQAPGCILAAIARGEIQPVLSEEASAAAIAFPERHDVRIEASTQEELLFDDDLPVFNKANVSLQPIPDEGESITPTTKESPQEQPENDDSESTPAWSIEEFLKDPDQSISQIIRHPDDTFEGVFSESETRHSLVLPEIDLEEPDDGPDEPWWRQIRKGPVLIALCLVLAAASMVSFGPWLVRVSNRIIAPPPAPSQNIDSEDKKHRLEAFQLDPDARFETQLGEVDAIIQGGQFLLARAYLARFKNNPQRVASEDYRLLERWHEDQKIILEQANRQTATLEAEVKKNVVIPDFRARTNAIRKSISWLAGDLQPTLTGSLIAIEKHYQSWIEEVRLKTDNAPTFFIRISRENPHPKLTFDALSPEVADWFRALENHPETSRIDHIETNISPFRGLNQFEMKSGDAINLSLWRQRGRSLISYLDGQVEVIEITDIPESRSITFHWRFQDSPFPRNTRNIGAFPEPPLILSFFDRQAKKGLNVVMLGGVSQSVTIPAEVPMHFLSYLEESREFAVVDAVLQQKLSLFLLPPSEFLRLRSRDDRYRFAWDDASGRFHLYDSTELDHHEVRRIQQEISELHLQLMRLERMRTVYESVAFVRMTPLWSLGKELLGTEAFSRQLEDFGTFCDQTPSTYFEYLRAILMDFAATNTVIHPTIMNQWLAYPALRVPETKAAILTYRDLLLRAAKRLRSLLREDDPRAVEHWRAFVTNLEFWLLGEHSQQLLDILSLTAAEISSVREADISPVYDSIQEIRDEVATLQSSLSPRSNLEGIQRIRGWILEIASIESERLSSPLIVFQ
jgi:hypothetical protein